MRVSNYLCYIFLTLCLLPLISNATKPDAKEATTSITTTRIQQAITDLPSQNLPEAEATAAKLALEQALQSVKTRDDYITKLATIKQEIAEAPAKTTSYLKEFEKLSAAPIPTINKETITDPELQQKLVTTNAQIEALQSELASLNANIQQLQTRPEQVQAQISALQVRSQHIIDQLKTPQPEAITLKLNVEQESIKAQTNFLTLELSSNSLLQKYYTSSRNLLTEKINRLQQESTELQKIINDRRTEATEKIIQDLAKDKQNQTNSLLRQESEENLKLSEYLSKANDRLNEITALNQTVKQENNTTKKIEETLTEQSLALKNSIFLSKILYQQKMALPIPYKNNALVDEIANLRLYQFQLNELQNEFKTPSLYVKKLLANEPNTSEEIQKELLALAETRQDLFSQLQTTLNTLITEAVSLQLATEQLQTKVNQISTSIDEKMFWLPSNAMLDLTWLKQAPSLLTLEINSISWHESLGDIGNALINKPWIFLPLLLLIAALTWKRRYLRDKISTLNQQVGNVKLDTQYNTPITILLNILLALPVALALVLAGIALLIDNQGMNTILANTLFEIAFGWVVFYTAYRLLLPNNVAIIHFKWNEQHVKAMRKHVLHIGILSTILISVVSIASQQVANLSQDVLGICLMIICYILMAIVITKIAFAKETRSYFTSFRLLLAIALSVLPIMLMVATIAGYYYTSLRLTDRLIDTLYTLILWFICEGVLIRWLSVAARRIAFQQLLEKRKNKQAKEGNDEDIIEEPVIDIDVMNKQSLRLMRLALIIIFGCVLYWIWADVVAVFSYLDSITLYQYTAADGVTNVPLTLKIFIVAMVIAFVTVILTRNLPGLLEMVVLSKLHLERGISYAITTLLTYIIVAFGASITLSLLGVSWGKLQWLVAALSVGLGFGLQEIFKNFVSGIILLFERPVRIGDRITVGGVTGTVNRIQIRATHITDSERKEIIIPNTTFATGQIINWTLTDTITRITLRIGVSYDSDVDKVKQTLLQIALNNPRVIKDPAPSVSFISFGASTIDFELTMLVSEIADRSATTDELNKEILNVFRKENIEMPCQQIDVTIKQ